MSPRPIMYLTRVEIFSACHRLHSSKLSDEENKELYGKCNNPNGHGHNYKLETVVKGPVDSTNGMVMNISSDLKTKIQRAVKDTMDHKNLDKDVPEFRDTGLVSTSENVALVIYRKISQLLPVDVKLHCVKIHETDKNIVEYRGEEE